MLRQATTVGLLAVCLLAAACATGPRRGMLISLHLTSADLDEDKYSTAWHVLSNHRELIIREGEIAFRGGNNLDGENVFYTVPLVVVNGNRDIGSPTTVLRQIRVRNIAAIRLMYASQVPPELRRPEASGGVISITTKDGSVPPG